MKGPSKSAKCSVFTNVGQSWGYKNSINQADQMSKKRRLMEKWRTKKEESADDRA